MCCRCRSGIARPHDKASPSAHKDRWQMSSIWITTYFHASKIVEVEYVFLALLHQLPKCTEAKNTQKVSRNSSNTCGRKSNYTNIFQSNKIVPWQFHASKIKISFHRTSSITLFFCLKGPFIKPKWGSKHFRARMEGQHIIFSLKWLSLSNTKNDTFDTVIGEW